MLDLKFVKEHLAEVKENIKNRNMVADADLVVKLYDERTALTTKLQSLQQKRNENAANMKQKLDPETRQKFIEEGKKIKEDVSQSEKELAEVEAKLLPADILKQPVCLGLIAVFKCTEQANQKEGGFDPFKIILF